MSHDLIGNNFPNLQLVVEGENGTNRDTAMLTVYLVEEINK